MRWDNAQVLSNMEIFYDKLNRRLVYIKEKASSDFWDEHWDTENFRKNIESGRDNRFILKTLQRHIPDKKGRILEGGCGRGQSVYCMHVHGYESIGLDFAEKTVEKTKELFPQLDVRVGDVRNLQFPDNYFAGYWSMGVIEHFGDGYQDTIIEMQRVLTAGGYVFLTFPCMSPLRKLKVKLGLYRGIEELNSSQREGFYQFALDAQTVIKDFAEIGFKLLERRPISGLKGFKDEISLFKQVLQRLFDYKGKSFWIRGLGYVLDKLLAAFAGHMMFLVFRNGK